MDYGVNLVRASALMHCLPASGQLNSSSSLQPVAMSGSTQVRGVQYARAIWEPLLHVDTGMCVLLLVAVRARGNYDDVDTPVELCWEAQRARITICGWEIHIVSVVNVHISG